ncbi:hypothetical protein GCM10009799_47480 [Nocardiopsis rhodophaea]|uniref:Secreted protein n=1 Tax=Nocardiopsis rhodophaea TaxID=280238 RepID=A0ABN2TNM5_9ACTN
MPLSTRLRALSLMFGELVLLADAYIAAVLDTRPLIHHAVNTAAWLGRSWRRCRSTSMTRQFGPGRGLVAVVITRPTTRKDTTRER